LSGRGLCDELITRPEESYRLCCVVVCDLETSRMGAPYIYDISLLRVKDALLSSTAPSNVLLNPDDWLTVHRSITLVDFKIDAQNSYLFIYNTFIKIVYMFRALPCSSSGGLRRNYICAASGIVTVCRWLSCAPVKKGLLVIRRSTS